MLGGVAANGTMLTFMAVSLSVLVLRRTEPKVDRPFAVPFGDYVIPLAALLSCGSLVAIAPVSVLASLLGWLAVGVGVYTVVRVRHPRKMPR